jgi:hypothetical protein
MTRHTLELAPATGSRPEAMTSPGRLGMGSLASHPPGKGTIPMENAVNAPTAGNGGQIVVAGACAALTVREHEEEHR